MGMGHGPGGPGMRGGAHGKPKDVGNTVKRLWSYVAVYKLRLLFVVLFMIFSTVTSLIGAYMLSPIINRIALAVNPDADISYSSIGKIADKYITKFSQLGFVSDIMSGSKFAEVLTYVL